MVRRDTMHSTPRYYCPYWQHNCSQEKQHALRQRWLGFGYSPVPTRKALKRSDGLPMAPNLLDKQALGWFVHDFSSIERMATGSHSARIFLLPINFVAWWSHLRRLIESTTYILLWVLDNYLKNFLCIYNISGRSQGVSINRTEPTHN